MWPSRETPQASPQSRQARRLLVLGTSLQGPSRLQRCAGWWFRVWSVIRDSGGSGSGVSFGNLWGCQLTRVLWHVARGGAADASRLCGAGVLGVALSFDLNWGLLPLRRQTRRSELCSHPRPQVTFSAIIMLLPLRVPVDLVSWRSPGI